MATSISAHAPQFLRAIVDMGSNGIRFSISDLQPPTQRIMPTLYQHRVGISLYDAQYSAAGERQPIDASTISAVIASFRHFKRTCADFQVPKEHITVLATEATRTAINSEEFRSQIKEAVGWDVTMLPKEEEGRVGGMGIASSLPQLAGLVMDLGGGSTQLSWIMHLSGSGVEMPKSGAVSMPYGAAAMSRRLGEAERNGTVGELRSEVQRAMKEAYSTLEVPFSLNEVAKRQGGFTLYLSGGGFRGWGYVLMSRYRIQPYPIPVINGFRTLREDFIGVEEVKLAAATTLQNEDDEIFRVSDRRASQVPAVAFLIGILAETLPQIKEVRFCQGGVREGYLYSSMTATTQAAHPLMVATQRYANASPREILKPLRSAFPPDSKGRAHNDFNCGVFDVAHLSAFANLLYYHSSYSKDLQPSAALRSTTSGVLAGVHGLVHESRALLALLLCARWGGDVPPVDQNFKSSLEQVIDSPETLWWIQYLGAAAALITSVYPAGKQDGDVKRLELYASWTQSAKGKPVLELRASFASEMDIALFGKELRNIEKVGKKKNWPDGREGFGHKISVQAEILK